MSGGHRFIGWLRGDVRGGWELRHMSISERKAMPEAVRRIEVFTGAGRRWNWSDAEKASIVRMFAVSTAYYADPTSCSTSYEGIVRVLNSL